MNGKNDSTLTSNERLLLQHARTQLLLICQDADILLRRNRGHHCDYLKGLQSAQDRAREVVDRIIEAHAHETSEWRPIETAPKERCTVVELAWDPDDWTTGDGFYFDGYWVAAAFFHSEFRAGIVKGPAHEIREWICHPTHWRPRRSDHPHPQKAAAPLCNHDLQSPDKTLEATMAPHYGWRCTVCKAEWYPEKGSEQA